MQVSVVVVNTNHGDLLRKCLRAVLQADLPEATEVIVVDNNSRDGSVAMLEREFPEVRVLRYTERRGPAANYNSGFAVANGEFIVVLNEDAEVSSNTLRSLYDYMVAHPKVAIAGPRLIYPDGRAQNCCNRFPRLSSAFKRLVLQRFLNGPIIHDQYREEAIGREFEPDWIMATSLMIRRVALQQTGTYDEQFEVFYEEVDLCRRLRLCGWTVAWVPEAFVKHHHGVSNFKLLSERDIVFRVLLYQSRYRYFRKHYGKAYCMMVRGVEASLFAVFVAKTSIEALFPSRHKVSTMKRSLYLALLRYALFESGSQGVPQA
jgi:GT2 family glycosyltransferase